MVDKLQHVFHDPLCRLLPIELFLLRGWCVYVTAALPTLSLLSRHSSIFFGQEQQLHSAIGGFPNHLLPSLTADIRHLNLRTTISTESQTSA
jgi:hypothetical protein